MAFGSTYHSGRYICRALSLGMPYHFTDLKEVCLCVLFWSHFATDAAITYHTSSIIIAQRSDGSQVADVCVCMMLYFRAAMTESAQKTTDMAAYSNVVVVVVFIAS